MLSEYFLFFSGGHKEMPYKLTNIRGPHIDIRQSRRNPVSLHKHQRKPSWPLSWCVGSNIDPGNEVRCLTS